ncbi:hypothetical protein H696_02722 [Fonticula alba]|uniref:Uncharacterized protein n=1 Tax=Fonticula alba TaxID=691883 RepID=A0A058Z8E1_FONAL|nr:hypothetical protein H696_02722 [Fonticula alba]KCV70386.1 hypothetical protein H696_02722 [Fonticula alba]|eukprot:XP_009494902.1 hypothetical protein H696_02722 [Fonticula alba]
MDTLASRQAPAHGRLGSLACLLLLALLPAMSAAAKLRVSVSRPHPPAHRLQLWIDTPLDEGTCVVLASGPGVNRRLGNPLLPSVVKVRPMAQPAGHDREHHHDAADELHVHKRTDLAGLLTSVHAPDASLTQGSISEIFAPSVTRAYDLARLRHGCNTFLDIDEALGQLDMVAPRYEAPHHGVGAFNTTDEIVDLAVSGEPLNRIDIVFMGDGYTGPERGLFMSDMRRMTDDLFDSPTFYSYLPLFNVWGLYRPSVDSGIGVDSTPRNTSFGLYRVGTELRAIYTSRPLEALRACHALGDGNWCVYVLLCRAACRGTC